MITAAEEKQNAEENDNDAHVSWKETCCTATFTFGNVCRWTATCCYSVDVHQAVQFCFHWYAIADDAAKVWKCIGTLWPQWTEASTFTNINTLHVITKNGRMKLGG